MANTTKCLAITAMEPFTKEEDEVKYDDIIMHGGISIKEVVEDIITQEDLSTIIPAAKLADLLVQNSLAEEAVNEAPWEFDAQLDIFGYQALLDPSAAMDYEQDVPLHTSEDERLLIPDILGTGFPFIDAKLAEAISQQSGDNGEVFSMEGQYPESGPELFSALTDASSR